MNSAVAFTVCSASAVTSLSLRSICPSTSRAMGTSFVLAPTSVWAAITELPAVCPSSAPSRWGWFPSASLAPRTVLPSRRTGISSTRSAGSAPVPVSDSGLSVSPSRPLTSQVLTAVSNTSTSASVTTRQIVAFDGGPTGSASARAYSRANSGAGRSLTQPAIAV
jgi:hypothetical protein